MELRVYPGIDASFTLYENENDNYNYEKGIYATIDIKWDDTRKLLSIGDRNGEFPGMLKTRKFHIVVVSEDHGVDVQITKDVDKVVKYS